MSSFKAKTIIASVPNFSTSDPKVLDKILEPFRGKTSVKLLDYSSNVDHNRSVVTVLANDGQALVASLFEAVKIATDLIDMRKHSGGHPRMGATDVVPFIPIKGITNDDCVQLSKQLGERLASDLSIPIFLYGKAASVPVREDLAKIRKGEFEQMSEKLKLPEWTPDYGGTSPHPTAGVTAVGARAPLIAFNINLNCSDIAIANAIAKRVRNIGGGLHFVKAIGIELKERGIVQVSMNMTDYTKTSLYTTFEMVKMEARRYGVTVIGSEIIGFTPMAALIDAAQYYLQLESFDTNQILEKALLEMEE